MIGGFAPGIPPGAQRVGSGAATQILTDVAREAACFASGFRDLCLYDIEFFELSADKGDPGAQRGEFMCRAAPDAGAPAGDDRDLP